MALTYPASPARIKFMRDLLVERDVPAEAAARLSSRLDDNNVTSNEAKSYIEWMLARPRVATAAPRRSGPQVGEGFYFHQGQVVKVERSDRGGYLFARIVTGAKFLKAPKGMLYRITPDEEMTPEAVAAYGVQHEVCCNCATKLSDPVSKKVGLGTKCGPDLLGSDSYKAARKAAEVELATANDDLVAHFTA